MFFPLDTVNKVLEYLRNKWTYTMNVNNSNLWKKFTKIPTIKKTIHIHANKTVSLEFRKSNIFKTIAEKKEEYNSSKVLLAVLKFMEKQTQNLSGLEELAKTIEQQTISITVIDLKNKCESISNQIKEEKQDLANTLTKLMAATH
ncbi:hypothetical protein BB561_006592 [Smittium simulii]|uniref:Uncharacterized protein n=1 Tax=Smittium simulii TaxID=133385 RepID=A0A2T9Y303_9FUNG|nr:hypothetical protein BB561_006592 [Smittium simulii]